MSDSKDDSGDSDIICIFDTGPAKSPTKTNASSSGNSVIYLSDSPLPTPPVSTSPSAPVDPVEKPVFADEMNLVDCDYSNGAYADANEPWLQLFHSDEKGGRAPRTPFASPGIADVAIHLDDDFDYNALFQRSGSKTVAEAVFDHTLSGGFIRDRSPCSPSTSRSGPAISRRVSQRLDFELAVAARDSDDPVVVEKLQSRTSYSYDSGLGTLSDLSEPSSSTSISKRAKKSKVADEELAKVVEEREAKRREKEAQKEKKRLEKEERDAKRKTVKLDKQAAKLEKQAFRKAYKPLQHGKGSLSHVTTHIPSSMINSMGREEFLLAFAEEGAQFRFAEMEGSDERSGVIHWTREHVTAAVKRNEESVTLNTTKQSVQEHHVLIQVSKKSFVAMVDFHKRSTAGVSNRESFHSFIQKWKRQFSGKFIHFFVYGMEKYFRNQLNKMVDSGKSGRAKPVRPSIAEIPYDVSYDDVEKAMLDVMCTHNTMIKQLETPKDVARCLIVMHRAIAHSHVKSMKSQETMLFDALSANTKTKGVTVSDSTLDGYRELWIRQLEQFNLISRDVAITIASIYGSPRVLLKAYDNCPTEREKECLLENLVVKRGTERRLGPKMSRLLYRYMCSSDGDEVLE